MDDYLHEQLSVPKLSRTRTFLFGALACVWFSEMMFLGFQSFSKVWSYLWQVSLPQNPQLETAQCITWALAAPAKGAFFVMAIIGLKSRNPSTRAALFASMSLVPPLNIVFPFRQQGFRFGPIAVAITLSTILWGSFFLVRERTQQPEQKESGNSTQFPPSRKEIFQYVWFAANSAFLTLIALFLLFGTRTALNNVFPCLTALLSSNEGALSSPIHSTMAAGTHLLALAIASWIATVRCRSNPTLRQTMTIASAVHAGLFLLFPLRQLIVEFGTNCATSSILVVFAPLFVGWLFYSAFFYRSEAKKQQEAYI